MSHPHFDVPFLRKTVAACVACACAACSTLPDYKKPTLDMPQHYANAAATDSKWSTATPGDALSRGQWWTIFDDPELNSLEARIDVSNQSVQKAVSMVEQARAMVQYQRAGFLPTITAGSAVSRARLYSQNVAGHATAGKTYPDFSVGVTASWEPDLFGRVKDAVVNARDTAQASQGDLESVRLSMASDLALDYFNLRALDIQKKLLDDTVKAYTDAFNIVEQEFKDGAVDGSVVAAAQTQLETARTQDTDIDVFRAQFEHAIATLIGVPASSFSLTPSVTPVAVPDIPVGVPSQLLERRPDIAAAERRVAAANAQIGLAHAAYYPNLRLSPTAGLESSYYGPWFTAGSLFWGLGAQLAGTIFDGGQRNAMVNNANAQYEGTVADYRQTVLVAFQQVEDNLSALHTLADEAQTQRRATEAAQLSLKLTTNRFQAGAVSYLDVVTAQSIALMNERNEDQIQARRVDAAVSLIKALGGGWSSASLKETETPASKEQMTSR
ncbi:MAG TPA: efflux transporter outer membrane subunit [Trinickia sp.]|jgi:NodT family efflux transporter outer membrane factor (OMF) lipoprotein|uniref:efflux transporter outer membrane subunit n=1 Tax=Trinickia sp. TaxID=2571163 RepID=UPI002C502663|nr:efflux transporter outer membrane subunit [Trinickia sp.]HTI17360.1 efflux transporter outer membrane subunit [Trinickia sp.]